MNATIDEKAKLLKLELITDPGIHALTPPVFCLRPMLFDEEGKRIVRMTPDKSEFLWKESEIEVMLHTLMLQHHLTHED